MFEKLLKETEKVSVLKEKYKKVKSIEELLALVKNAYEPLLVAAKQLKSSPPGYFLEFSFGEGMFGSYRDVIWITKRSNNEYKVSSQEGADETVKSPLEFVNYMLKTDIDNIKKEPPEHYQTGELFFDMYLNRIKIKKGKT